MQTPQPKLVYSVLLSKSAALTLTVASVPMAALAFGLAHYLAGGTAKGGNPVGLVLAYIAVLIVHEFVHGLFFMLAGGKPRYGAALVQKVLPVFYATAPGQLFSLRQMLAVGLSPFVLLSAVLGVALAFAPVSWVPYLIIAFVGNFAGAVGDLYLMRAISRFAACRRVFFRDSKDGIDVLCDDPRAVGVAAELAALDRQGPHKQAFWFIWVGVASLLLVLSVALVPVLVALSHGKDILIGSSSLPLFMYTSTKDSAEITLNLLPPIIFGFVAAITHQLTRRATVVRKRA